jgi:hypothetical protein
MQPHSQVNPPLGQGHVTLTLSDPSAPYMCVCVCVVLCFGRQVPRCEIDLAPVSH